MRSKEEIQEMIETMQRTATLLVAHGKKRAAELLNAAMFWLEWVIREEKGMDDET